jgi:hypothetical protein
VEKRAKIKVKRRFCGGQRQKIDTICTSSTQLAGAAILAPSHGLKISAERFSFSTTIWLFAF